MKKQLSYFMFLLIIVSLNSCKKDSVDKPCTFELVDVKKGQIEVYSNTGLIANSLYTVDNIIGNDWFNKNTINEIYFNSSKLASLKFNESDLKQAFDYYHSDMSVSYNNDSIYFKAIKVGLNNLNDTISVKGINYKDSIKLFGIFFSLNVSSLQGVEYGYFNKDKFISQGNGHNDTLALFHFTLTFKKK